MREYIEQALRTESVDLFKVDNPRLLHAAIGINTEFGELMLAEATANFLEEVGDVLWYVAILASEIEASFDELELLGRTEIGEHPRDEVEFFFGHVLNILDVTKRGLFYGVPLDELKLAKSAGVVLVGLRWLLEDDNFTLEQAMAANIAKLARRYPDKFTTEAAINRDLSAEEQELKKHV